MTIHILDGTILTWTHKEEEKSMQSNIHQNLVILRLKEVTAFTGVSRSVIYEKLNTKSKSHDPNFPKPIKLSSNAVGWFEHEIIQWLELKAEQRFTC